MFSVVFEKIVFHHDLSSVFSKSIFLHFCDATFPSFAWCGRTPLVTTFRINPTSILCYFLFRFLYLKYLYFFFIYNLYFAIIFFVFLCGRIPLVPTFRINPTSILCSLDARAKITQTHLCANFCTNQFVGECICTQISFCKYILSISAKISLTYFCTDILREFL